MKLISGLFNARYFFFLCLLSFCFSCAPKEKENGFVLKGNITGLTTGKAILKKLDLVSNTTVVLDTVVLEDGTFSIEGTVDQPYPHSLVINDSLRVNFFLENTKMEIDIDMNEGRMDVIGSSSDSLFQPYWARLEEMWSMGDSLQLNRLLSKTKEDQKRVDSLLAVQSNAEMIFTLEFISDNPASYVAPFAAFYFVQTYEMVPEGLREILDSFDPKVKNSIYLEEIEKIYKLKSRLTPGQPAPDFSIPDKDGKLFSLESFKGKLVLLDFWASWCKPCREQNPHWLKIYETYKNKDFVIVGVSVDSDKEAWLKAIELDGLTWPQLSPLNGWTNNTAEIYGVKAIPHNFLIGYDGNIIGEHITLGEMEALLQGL
jgi:peroxiredoxin